MADWFHEAYNESSQLEVGGGGGFEPRGTDIRGWMNAGYFIQKKVFDGELLLAPGVVLNMTKEKLSLSMGGIFSSEENELITNLNNPRKVPRTGVASVIKGKNLMLPEMLRSICSLKDEAIKRPCGDLCDVISLPDLISEIRGTNCRNLTDNDVVIVNDLLRKCAKFYFDGSLTRNCSKSSACPGVDKSCTRHGTIYRIFNDFTDKEFMAKGNTSMLELTYSTIFIQWYGSVESLRRFFTANLGENGVYNDNVRIHGIKLMIQKVVFQWYLIQDLIWYGLAMGVVILLLVIYLRSFVLMITVILNVIFSLLLAYWIYFMVIRFTFFPFINILAALLLVALGADDLFIFYDIWRDEKLRQPKASYEELISHTLRKGGTSVFVTSFTTSTALLANFVNDVTAIRCFGMFAAICVLVNFLLFITWVPAIFVITDYAYASCLGDDFCYDKSLSACKCFFTTHKGFWNKVMPTAVNKTSILWIILSLAMASGGLTATFWKPKLDLPSTNSFRLLVPSHPFEVYERQLKEHLRFEDDALEMGVQLLWGAEGADNGDLLNPDAFGSLVVDPTFDIYLNTSQLWLARLCESLMEQDFIDEKFAGKAKCYWQYYKEFVSTQCFNVTSCCEQHFPLSYNMSKRCMKELAYILMKKNVTALTVGLPLFDDKGMIKVFQMSFKTSYTWTANYEQMKLIYERIESFMTSKLRSAPRAVSGGWFTGRWLYEFGFFDLQMSLASGTLNGIGISMAIGFTVLLFTTVNIFLAVYAIVTIALVLSTTTGILALMGWELNTSEALTLTLSMGLSIDFTIHNGVAYKLSEERRREDKVTEALSSVGSAITMAGLTTLGAGASMMCGSVWAYRQFGVFLVLTMLLSWYYAMFFFMSLCSTIGPVGKVGDFGCAFSWMKRKTKKKYRKENGDLTEAASETGRRLDNGHAPRQQMDEQPSPPPPRRSSLSQSHEFRDDLHSMSDRNSYISSYENDGFDPAPERPPRKSTPHRHLT
ncbi:hypothetical protein LSH36_82g06018 [Paralvinella palmiformis]|uniref:SSD domain-containing protein n=1 Tax=Paralvinella palmiformis TaxID=53620 RepID=A0AAD9K3L6_9ANNE|nr:hypothetical protein LSH36_82g06018 [Paralvinella palmiformis]